MKVLDPGHRYELAALDGDAVQTVQFVKRDFPPERYPGNVGSYSGTTMQECLRALIDRAEYVNRQTHSPQTTMAAYYMRVSLYYLEERAARRHGLGFEGFSVARIETYPVCPTCGHLVCHHMAVRKAG